MTLPWFTALIRDNGMVCETNPWFFVYAEFMALWSCQRVHRKCMWHVQELMEIVVAQSALRGHSLNHLWLLLLLVVIAIAANNCGM